MILDCAAARVIKGGMPPIPRPNMANPLALINALLETMLMFILCLTQEDGIGLVETLGNYNSFVKPFSFNCFAVS